MTVTATNAEDDISPIKSVSYFKYNGDTALDGENLINSTMKASSKSTIILLRFHPVSRL